MSMQKLSAMEGGGTDFLNANPGFEQMYSFFEW